MSWFSVCDYAGMHSPVLPCIKVARVYDFPGNYSLNGHPVRPRLAGRYEGRKSLRLIRKRAGVLGPLTAAISLVVTLGLVTPAQAALSGSDWIMKKLPARYSIRTAGPAASPVSCMPGTKFCVAIVPGIKNLVNGALRPGGPGHQERRADLDRPRQLPTSLYILAVSCATSKVCWATGTSWATGGPDVVETTDGGRKWADVTPAAWANDHGGRTPSTACPQRPAGWSGRRGFCRIRRWRRPPTAGRLGRSSATSRRSSRQPERDLRAQRDLLRFGGFLRRRRRSERRGRDGAGLSPLPTAVPPGTGRPPRCFPASSR